MFEFADIETLDSHLKIEDKIILFFETSWNDECSSFICRLIDMYDSLDDIPIYRVELDLDGGDYVEEKFGVYEAPTLILFKYGAEYKRITNELLLEDLSKLI